MLALQLKRLDCFDTSDVKYDDIYINVNGERVWGIVEMRPGDKKDLSSLGQIKIPDGQAFTMEVWDEDTSSPDDLIGSVTANKVTENAEQDLRDEGYYRLYYSVTQVP